MCALCGSERRRVVHAEVRDVQHGLPGRFTIVRCAACSLVYLCPRPTPDAIGRYYPAEYGPFQGDEALPTVDATGGSRIITFLRQATRLPYRLRYGPEDITMRPFGNGRMLDVGCGAGVYLAAMHKLGWDARGVDMSAAAVRAACARVGRGRAWVGTLDALDPALQDLDLITMNHCLEHVPDPRATLLAAHDHLRPDGLIKIIVPDISGLEARLLGRSWLGLDPPRHLYNFSRRTLSHLLVQSDFALVSCRPTFSPASAFGSVVMTVDRRWPKHPQHLGTALRSSLFLLTAAAYACGNRGAIEVVARRGTRSLATRLPSTSIMDDSRAVGGKNDALAQI